jgi:phosphate/sulfate permease
LRWALFIALGFEFVNRFHDTANAVATVIYTHSLPPVAALIMPTRALLPSTTGSALTSYSPCSLTVPPCPCRA